MLNNFLPDVARIETSGACNFKCIHCPNGHNQYKRGNMSLEIFELLLQQWKEKNYIPRVCVMYHGGEPLLNPYTPYMIKKVHELGVKKTKMNTNASLLTKENRIKIIDSGLTQLNTSFDGNTPEENNTLRRGGNFYKDVENVVALCEENKTIDIVIANARICTENDLKSLENSTLSGFSPPQHICLIYLTNMKM